MEKKSPVMLLVLVETGTLRWFVAAVGLDGQFVPLLRSEVGDLEKYRGLDWDEQVAFLRHRFCGVVQRGCDRIWARNCKACQFVFVFEGLLPDPTGGLTQAVAEHFTQWMLNPPVVVFNTAEKVGPGDSVRLDSLAGQIDPPLEALLLAQLGKLLDTQNELGVWELAPRKRA